jgi:hypothetical protein
MRTARGREYRGYIMRTIRPVLGEISINKLTARMRESFYAELLGCRVWCDRPPLL